jgi:hypothetical protein
MATRALFPIIGVLLLAGCAAGVAPTDSPPTATDTPAAQASPSQAEPTMSVACEPGDDGVTQVVPGTANIFGAGRDEAPAPGGGGAGSLPPVWELPPGSTMVSIPCATGEVTPLTAQPLMNGPAGDRRGAGGESTGVSSYEGISGITNRNGGMFLVGVFLTDAVPSDPAPERLDFTDNEDFGELAPEIAQTFFIGDGVGRSFRIPAGATRLFLGFADAYLYRGPPGWYGNNGGELEVTVAVQAD